MGTANSLSFHGIGLHHSAWQAKGYQTSGSWEEVFGKSVVEEQNPKVLSYLPEELFSVYHYTKFVGQLAAAGKEAYPIPLFVNAWPKALGFTGVPGQYGVQLKKSEIFPTQTLAGEKWSTSAVSAVRWLSLVMES